MTVARASFLADQVATVRASWTSRKLRRAPPLGGVVLAVGVGVTLAVLAAWSLSPASDPGFHFRDERGLVTTLSAVSLAMASGFAGACWHLERAPGHGLRGFWAIACLGFLFLAADELLQFHEQGGRFVRNHLLGEATVFRNWNDVIVIVYGLLALPLGLRFLPRLLALPRVIELFVLGFLAYIAHTAVDSLPHAETGLSGLIRSAPPSMIEESAKLFASSFFAAAMLSGLLVLVHAPAPLPRTEAT